ncbi:esterase [uncultured Bosea sp.]|uniref:esterase n=1 Tax=uncultured Bosea sp. TaxID=211457 RepID=UPI0025E30E50|nr:esterase [uncultured Bosea sp.]
MRFRIFAGLTLSLMGLAAPQFARAEYAVKEVGSFYIGGQEQAVSGQPISEIATTPGMRPFRYDPNGEFEVGQMYVQYVRQARPRSPLPLLMWHGGGLTGVTWETKPDGKPGWQQYFLNAGYDVYVSDSVERGRASWSRLYDGPPIFRTKKEGWELFRIGPPDSYSADAAKRASYPGVQFPKEDFDQFTKEFTPRWLTNDARSIAAYQQLVDKVCPCIVVVHSQGGFFGYNAALNNPEKIKALVLVEPSGAPDPAKIEVAKLKSVPMLAIWGDNIKGHPLWQNFAAPSARLREAVQVSGGTFDWVSLPDAGMTGNTHMMMMDKNSDQIADLVRDWLTKHGL